MATVGIGAVISIGASFAAAALTPKPKVRGSLDTLSTLRSELGVSIPLVIGENRITGNIYWALSPERIEASSGGKGSSGSPNEEMLLGSFGVVFCEGIISDFGKIWFNNKLVYNPFSDDPATVAKSIEFANDHMEIYLGTTSQGISPFIQANETRPVTALRRRAHIVFKDVDITDYGATPKVEAEIIETAGVISLRTVLEDIFLNKTTLSNLDYDVTPLEIYQIGGLILPQDGSSIRDFIEELQQIYHFITVEDSGVINFIPLVDQESVVDIPNNAMGVREYGASWEEPVIEKSVNVIDLPSKVEIEFNNINNNYERGHKQVIKQTASHNNPTILKTTAAITDSEAITASTKTIEYAWNQQRIYEGIVLDFDYLSSFRVGDAIDIAVRGESVKVLTKTKNIGANLTVEVEAVAYNSFVNAITIIDSTDTEYTPVDTIDNFGNPTPIALDLPLLGDSETTHPDYGVYVSVEEDPAANASWNGGASFVSTNGSPFVATASVPSAAAIGTLITPLGSGNPYVVDRGSTFQVQITQGQLNNIPEQEFCNYSNLAYINGELLAIKNANIISTDPDIYEVNTIMRGVRGTERNITNHAIGTNFYLVQGDRPFVTVPGDVSTLGATLDIKVVPAGSVEGTITNETQLVTTGARLMPYAPTHPRIIKQANGDLVLSWVRRTRRNGYWLGTSEIVPLNEDDEAYDLLILDAPATGILRTVTVVSTTYTYTVAQQLSDFGVAPTTLSFNVYQRSALLGRGAALEPRAIAVDRVIP